MKRLPILASLLLLLWCSGCISSYPHKTPEQLGKTLLKVMKNQDAKGLGMVLPTEADFESYLATADMPEEEADAMRNEMAELLADFKASNEHSLADAIDAASGEGILLKKAKLGEIKVARSDGLDNPLADIDVEVIYNDTKYVLHITGAGQMPKGWVLGLDGFTFQKAE